MSFYLPLPSSLFSWSLLMAVCLSLFDLLGSISKVTSCEDVEGPGGDERPSSSSSRWGSFLLLPHASSSWSCLFDILGIASCPSQALKLLLLHVWHFSGSAPLIASGFSCDPNTVISFVNSLAPRMLSQIATKMTSLEVPHWAETNYIVAMGYFVV